MIRLVILALALGASAQRAEVYPALHAVVDVALDDVLNIRAAPDAEAEVIGALAPDAMGIEVLGVSDGWALVNAGEGSGYAAVRYLTREEGPDWQALARPLSCFGTEPFWSLALNADTRTSTYFAPDLAAPVEAEISQIWPGTTWAPTAALALEDGMAVLRPAECSDGMSDRRFGIAVDVFLKQGDGQQGDGQRLSGCCTLALP